MIYNRKARHDEYPMCCMCRQWLKTDSDGFILEHECPTFNDDVTAVISSESSSTMVDIPSIQISRYVNPANKNVSLT